MGRRKAGQIRYREGGNMKQERQLSIFDSLIEPQEEQGEQIAVVEEKRPTIAVATEEKPSGKKKMDNAKINELFGIKESFELPEKLMLVLMDKPQREALFNEFLQYDFDFSHDCLRDYFQDEHAARSALKQDYTPDCICDLINLLMPETDKIIDICSGTGALTIGTGRKVYFQCEELSKASVPILLFNLAIRGLEATVLQKNVLTNSVEKIYQITHRGGQYSDIDILETYEEIKTSVVISNPPYSLPWTPQQDSRFEGYPLAPKGAADYAFVLDGLSRLTDNGTAFYILPHGVLFRGNTEGKIRQQLIENNLIDAVIGLPDKLFLNTSIPVFILVLKKNRQRKDVLFIDGSKLFIKGSKQNVMSREQIEKIANIYWERQTADKLSYVATLEDICQNAYNLNIPRYVDTYEPKVLPSIEEITKDIINCRLKEKKAEKELLQMLAELLGDDKYNTVKDEFLKYMTEQDIVGETMQEWLYLQELERRTDQIAKKAKREKRNILELTDFERVKKGKIYPSGTVYIQLSATDGVVRYLLEAGTLEAKYGVFVPKSDILPSRYLFYMLEYEMPHFLARYQAGMNINPDIFKHLQVTYYPELKYQRELAILLDNVQAVYGQQKDEKEKWETFKKYHLEGMFPNM